MCIICFCRGSDIARGKTFSEEDIYHIINKISIKTFKASRSYQAETSSLEALQSFCPYFVLTLFISASTFMVSLGPFFTDSGFKKTSQLFLIMKSYIVCKVYVKIRNRHLEEKTGQC